METVNHLYLYDIINGYFARYVFKEDDNRKSLIELGKTDNIERLVEQESEGFNRVHTKTSPSKISTKIIKLDSSNFSSLLARLTESNEVAEYYKSLYREANVKKDKLKQKLNHLIKQKKCLK